MLTLIADITRLEPVLAHFHARVKNRLPLADPQEEQLMRGTVLGRNHYYLRIRQQLGQAMPLSAALDACPGVPKSLVATVRRGEEGRDLAGALETALRDLPMLSRFQGHLRAIVLYAGVILGLFLLFLLFQATVYSGMVATCPNCFP